MKDKEFKQLKESLHDLWGEMEREKVSLEQAHEAIKALNNWLTNFFVWGDSFDNDDEFKEWLNLTMQHTREEK